MSAVSEETFKVKVILKDADGNVVLDKDAEVNHDGNKAFAKIEADMEQVTVWDNHTPYLYNVLVEISDNSGEILEVVPFITNSNYPIIRRMFFFVFFNESIDSFVWF